MHRKVGPATEISPSPRVVLSALPKLRLANHGRELRAFGLSLSLDDRARARAQFTARVLGTTAEALVPTRYPRRPGDLPRAGDIVHTSTASTSSL